MCNQFSHIYGCNASNWLQYARRLQRQRVLSLSSWASHLSYSVWCVSLTLSLLQFLMHLLSKRRVSSCDFTPTPPPIHLQTWPLRALGMYRCWIMHITLAHWCAPADLIGLNCTENSFSSNFFSCKRFTFAFTVIRESQKSRNKSLLIKDYSSDYGWEGNTETLKAWAANLEKKKDILKEWGSLVYWHMHRCAFPWTLTCTLTHTHTHRHSMETCSAALKWKCFGCVLEKTELRKKIELSWQK